MSIVQVQLRDATTNGKRNSSISVMDWARRRSSVNIQDAKYFLRLGTLSIALGIASIVVQIAATTMASLYIGLYAFNWDPPRLAKSSIGFPAGLIFLLLGLSEVYAAGKMKRVSLMVHIFNSKVFATKILSGISILFSLLMFCISVYLIWVLSGWWHFYEDPVYTSYIDGPVTAAVFLNVVLCLLSTAGLGAALAGLLVNDL